MRNLILAGALAAVLVSPAFAEDPYDPTDPYATDARHLSARSQVKAQSQDVQILPEAQPSWASELTVGMSSTDNGPNGTVIRHGVVVGQDPDPTVRAVIGSEVNDQGVER